METEQVQLTDSTAIFHPLHELWISVIFYILFTGKN